MNGVLPASAPAKVNLALAVGDRRDDGFHTLSSVFLRLALHDDLEVRLSDDPGGQEAPSGDEVDRLVVTGDADCPVEGNLVLRAAAGLRASVGVPFPALSFRLHKRIPMGAGLAGGSSDGSAALDLAAAAWGLRLHPAERLQAALRLGADVPFFSAGHGAALVGGIGEGLEPLPTPDPAAGILLVTPRQRLSTALVFATLDAGNRTAAAATGILPGLADLLRAGLDGPGLANLATWLRDANDLWPAASALSPGLPGIREHLESELGRPFLLTGSGTTLYGIYPSAAAALDAAEHLAVLALSELAGVVINATTTEEGPRA